MLWLREMLRHVFAALGLIFDLISAAVAVLSTGAWLASHGESLPWQQSTVRLTVLGSFASGVLGVAVGALSRNQVVAIVTLLVRSSWRG